MKKVVPSERLRRELDDVLAFFLHLPGLFQHRTADVVADVGELARLQEGLHEMRLRRGVRAGYLTTAPAPRRPHR